MTLLIAIGWTLLIALIVWMHHGMGLRRRKAEVPKRRSPVVLTNLLLSPEHLAAIQADIIAVGVGAADGAVLGFDHVSERGVSRVVIVICSGPMFEGVVEPALQKHMSRVAT